MAISRSLMNRQLQANGGIMNVTPRENFGLGSSLKRFVRKIIPNEISEIAVKAAPFVAPFNPGVAAAMSGIGGFDQTGKMGSSFKNAAMTYGLGQGARYLGGAGFQGNPFTSGAFTPSGFTSGFSSPFGSKTGLGELFSKSKPNAPIKGVNSGRAGDSASALSRSGATTAEQIAAQGRAINAEQKGLFTEGLTGGAEIIPTNLNDYAAAEIIPTNLNDYAGTATNAFSNAGSAVPQAKPDQGFFSSIVEKFQNKDYSGLGREVLDKAKEGGKALFTKPIPGQPGKTQLDKAAVMGAIAFAGSYAEALALADEAGIEITVEEYDEAKKAEKQEEYAGYLTNFFGGKKDGGRIGYAGGANELIKDKLIEDIMQDTSTEEMIMIMTDDGPKMVKKSDYEAMPGMFRDTTTGFGANINRIEEANGGRIGYKDGTIILAEDELAEMGGEQGLKLKLLAEKFMEDGMSESDAYAKAADSLYAKGGRVNRRLGSPEKGEGDGLMEMLSVEVDAGGDEEEDMLMAYTPGFSSQEKSYLFRKLGGAGGSDRSFTMPQLYRVLKNPADYPEDAAVLKEIAIMGLGKKDGGRIGLKDGSPPSGMMGLAGPEVVEAMGEKIGEGASSLGKLITDDEGNVYTVLQYLRKFGEDAFFGGQKNPELPEKFYNKLGDEYIQEMDKVKERGYRNGGRIGLKDGSGSSNRVAQLMLERDYLLSKDEDVSFIDLELERDFGIQMKAEGGIMEAKVPTGQMRKNNAGVAERDYRQTGGFVPVGIKERADDVPAMLSKNEFVMTADAVRGLGNGSVEEGSKKLYNTMKQAEQVGKA